MNQITDNAIVALGRGENARRKERMIKTTTGWSRYSGGGSMHIRCSECKRFRPPSDMLVPPDRNAEGICCSCRPDIAGTLLTAKVKQQAARPVPSPDAGRHERREPVPNADRTEPITITVTINGGLVSGVLLPPGWEDRITVRVENEDTEDANETEIQEDADGRTYTTVLWP